MFLTSGQSDLWRRQTADVSLKRHRKRAGSCKRAQNLGYEATTGDLPWNLGLHHVKSRPAKVGDKLTTRDFGTGTRGFAASEDANTAVCLLPGTELSFAGEVRCVPRGPLGWSETLVNHKTLSFGKSTRTGLRPTTMPWNFRTAEPCY